MPASSATVRCVVDWPSWCDATRAGRRRGRRTGHRRVRRAWSVDQRAPLGRERVRQQAAQRHVEEGRVGEVRVAVGEREARGLEEAVQRLRCGRRRASREPSRMFSASPTVEPPEDGGPMP